MACFVHTYIDTLNRETARAAARRAFTWRGARALHVVCVRVLSCVSCILLASSPGRTRWFQKALCRHIPLVLYSKNGPFSPCVMEREHVMTKANDTILRMGKRVKIGVCLFEKTPFSARNLKTMPCYHGTVVLDYPLGLFA